MNKFNNKIYIFKETTQERNYKIAIAMYKHTLFNIASFQTLEQLEFFKKTLGFEYEIIEIRNVNTKEELKIGICNYKIIDGYFWHLEELPKNAKPIKALSNGSIVTCYYCKNYKTNTITIYRPNPNAKEVYKPLELEEHINHKRIYGTY